MPHLTTPETCPQGLAHVIAHEFGLLQFVGLPLQLGRPPLHVGGMVGHGIEKADIVVLPVFVIFPCRVSLDDAVNLQVGIAADGGREVTVVLRRQAEMTPVLRRIDGPLHGPQGNRRDEVLLVPALYFGKQCRNVRGLYLIVFGMNDIAELFNQCFQLLDSLLVRHVMHPVYEGESSAG